MTDFPTLQDIANDHNSLAAYVKYVARCIDDNRMPMKYHEWELYQEDLLDALISIY